MRNITKTNNKEIKMETTFLTNNLLEDEINEFFHTNATDWETNKTTLDFDEYDEVDDFIEFCENEELLQAYHTTEMNEELN